MTLAGGFRLGKTERLKSRKEIEQLFQSGKTFMLAPFRIHYLVKKTEIPRLAGKARPRALQFGIGVPTRNFKKAVDRNRIKRLVRESWRYQKNSLQEQLAVQNRELVVFLIYTGRESAALAEIKEKTQAIIQKLSGILARG